MNVYSIYVQLSLFLLIMMVVNASTWEGLWMPIDPSSAYDELKMHYKKECRLGVMVRLGVRVRLGVMVRRLE